MTRQFTGPEPPFNKAAPPEPIIPANWIISAFPSIIDPELLHSIAAQLVGAGPALVLLEEGIPHANIPPSDMDNTPGLIRKVTTSPKFSHSIALQPMAPEPNIPPNEWS